MQQRERDSGSSTPAAVEQRPRLVEGEPEVGRADLGQLAFKPQPVQSQPQIMPGGQHDPQLRRAAHQQQLELAQRLGRPQLVHIIDHQPESGPPAASRSASNRSTTAQPSRSGAAVSGRTSAEPAAVRRSASSTETQNRCGSCSSFLHRHPGGALGQAGASIHDRSKNVFPLPPAPTPGDARRRRRAARTTRGEIRSRP